MEKPKFEESEQKSFSHISFYKVEDENFEKCVF